MTTNPAITALMRHMLTAEAQASTALDHDPRAHTISFEDLTPEQRAKWESIK